MKLFIDIETVPFESSFDLLSDESKIIYQKKFGHELENNVAGKHDNFEDHYKGKAGLFAEFGKIVCVSMGYVSNDNITLKSFCSDDEPYILIEVAKSIEKATSLVAHNGKDFDYPWLCRRMIINGIRLPSLLQIQNLKPWEIKLEDTVDLWKFGQFSHKTSLALMCSIFGLPSPKSGMDGSMVQEVFADKDFDKISNYCEGDVIAVINIYRKMNYLNPIV